MLSKLSDTLSSTKLILPWLLATAGIPSFFSGLLVPIREAFSMLPQVFIGVWIIRYPIRKMIFISIRVLQALAIFFVMLVALTTTGTVAGWLVLLCVLFYSVARSFSSISSKDILGKTISKEKRGTLSGYANAFAGGFFLILGCAVAYGLIINTFSISICSWLQP